MRKEILQKIEIPEKLKFLIEENHVTVKGPEGENKRKLNLKNIEIKKRMEIK